MTQKVIPGCEGVKFYQVDWERTRTTNHRQPTQTREIEDSGERSTVATRGTAKLLDSSVGAEVTRQHDASRLSFTGIAHEASAKRTAALPTVSANVNDPNERPPTVT